MGQRGGARPLLVGLAIALGIMVGVWWWMGAPLRSDERVILFPSAAHLDQDGQDWIVPVHGWVYEPEDDGMERAALIKLIGKAVAVGDDSRAKAILRHRLMPFLADNQRNKRITVRIGDITTQLEPSDAGGHFHGTLAVPIAVADRLAVEDRLTMDVLGTARTTASVRLIGARGLSVISDIDDTIKITQVTDKHALVRNTFMKPFAPAPGMAELFQRWNQAGAEFHYVSSSPWQLYESLHRFMSHAGFPLAAVNLKRFRLRDSSVFDLLADPRETKPAAIEPILKRYPDHLFRLVGDSGERDPEVYGAIARAHPDQITGIYIRNVTGEAPDGERFRKAFADVPEGQWHVFTHPAELTAQLPPEPAP
jgi:phosphatidate phosphatase APP1